MASVFVFGSNTHGRHGAGSALEAKTRWGAKDGKGEGRSGNSYAIPTRTLVPRKGLVTLSLEEIKAAVDRFLQYAEDHPNDDFIIVAIGCGFAGYRPHQIAPMFKNAPNNCVLPKEFRPYLSDFRA